MREGLVAGAGEFAAGAAVAVRCAGGRGGGGVGYAEAGAGAGEEDIRHPGLDFWGFCFNFLDPVLYRLVLFGGVGLWRDGPLILRLTFDATIRWPI